MSPVDGLVIEVESVCPASSQGQAQGAFMAEEKVGSRDITWRQLLPATELFRGFQVALDLNKLLLAAAGILLMYFAWVLLAWIFTAGAEALPPAWPGKYTSDDKKSLVESWQNFRNDRLRWNLLHETAGLQSSGDPARFEVADLAESPEEFTRFENAKSPEQANKIIATMNLPEEVAERYKARYQRLGQPKPSYRLNVSPWTEDRGPNPYLLLTGQTAVPWTPGHFWEWFTRDQAPVLLEPFVKLVMPVRYFFRAPDFTTRLYFALLTLSTLLIWSFFGGAITRIAVVQLTRGESIGLFEALSFTCKRWMSFLTAPLFLPLFALGLIILMILLIGLLHFIPYLGDFTSGLLWPIALVFGLILGLALIIGLLGWPLMPATISGDGGDSWEAVNRAFSYLTARPWYYAGYGLLAIVYGGILVLIVGFLGSMGVYLAKWGVNQTPLLSWSGRDTAALCIYAPTSFGWRELLLEGARTADQRDVVEPVSRFSTQTMQGNIGGDSRWSRINPDAYKAYVNEYLGINNRFGAALVAFWLGLFFLLVLGFGYSYFWTASTIIYLLLRKSVDSQELDEVYLDEEEPEVNPIPATPPATQPATTLPLVSAAPVPSASAAPPPTPVAAPTSTPTPPPTPVAAPTPTAAPTPVPVPTPVPPVASTPPVSVTPQQPASEPVKPSTSETEGSASA